MIDISVKEKVIAIVNRISGGRTKNIDLNGDLKNQLSLDSIQIVELFARLEKEFDIELPLKMMTVKTGREFLELLEQSLPVNKTK